MSTPNLALVEPVNLSLTCLNSHHIRRASAAQAPSADLVQLPGPQNSRYWTRFFRYSSTTGSITTPRQERQIVQSWLNLGGFLP